MQRGAESADVQVLTGFLLYNHEALIVELNVRSESSISQSQTDRSQSSYCYPKITLILKMILLYAYDLILFI